jgi:hypothetical protein
MEDAPISRFPVPKLEDLPDGTRAHILQARRNAAFVRNVRDACLRRH